MVKVFCAIVGAGSSFPVDIDENETVGDLKEAIKEEKKHNVLKDVDPDELQLFLAKKKTDEGEGKASWLTKKDVEEGVNDTINLKPLDVEMAPLSMVGLSETDVAFEVTVEHIKTRTTPVNVMVVVPVVVPKVSNVMLDRVARPKGSRVNLSSCDDLLAFLETQMTQKEEIVGNPYILDAESLQFRLVGREAAIKTAADCFNRIIEATGRPGFDRTKRVLPVCSGLSGLGKTRMLEEGGTIFQEMKVDPEHVVRVIVPYNNGYNLRPVERSMSINASFSWRILYRFFLDGNCSSGFVEWFESRLPCNGSELEFDEAMRVIERKLRQSVRGQKVRYLFLGIDDYQKIEKLNSGTNTGNSTLRQLVEIIAGFVCQQSSSLIVLPMFAGTDLGAIASSSFGNSSYYVTKRLPMTLLTMGQVVNSVESNANFAGYLRYPQVYRHLFALGGVPRWVVEYILELNRCSEPGTIRLENINNCFVRVWTRYVDIYLGSLEIQQFVRLAAVAVSGQRVQQNDTFDKEFKWSKLRDSSLCLLIPSSSTPNDSSSTPSDYDVRIPYTLLQSISSSEGMKSEAEQFFLASLKDMRELVDSTLFDREPRQSWEMFGACFYAVRINALLVLGHSTVTLGQLLPGAQMTDATRRISVKLSPSIVFQCAEEFGSSTPQLVSQKYNLLRKKDWTKGGSIIVNGADGAGVDIFFALKDAHSEDLIVIVDQRKRQFGTFQPSQAEEYLRKLREYSPKFLKKNTRLVGGVLNCVAPSNLLSYKMPHDCFLLARDETERFHGTLAYHPACSPIVPINSAYKTGLKSVLTGSEEHIDSAAEEILRKRKEPSGGFVDHVGSRD